MKIVLASAAFVLMSALSSTAFARNTVHEFDIKAAMEDPARQKASFSGRVQFFFGGQAVDTEKLFAEERTSQKTNAFNKSDEEACRWAFYSALIRLEKAALEQGADAVVNIKSNYENNEFISTEKYRCGAGALMAGVALKGTPAKLKK